jgi:integrase
VSLYRHPKSAYWWTRFTIGGREVRQSTGTKDRRLAEEYEQRLRTQFWRVVKLGEAHHTWGQAEDRWLRERAGKRSIERDRRIFAEYAELRPIGLRELSADAIAELREAREKAVSPATANRELALIRAVLTRAARHWRWIDHAPLVPMAKLELPDPRFVTRQQFQRLADELPQHAAQMARFAVATGLRRSNITGLTWDRIEDGFAYIPGSQAKGKRGIPVPLNREAQEVLDERAGIHETHVFTFRGKPITQVATKAWRAACKAAGLEGLRFHDLRHTWASWQAQAGTPMHALRELGGWTTDAMVRRYAHLGPGDLAQYADRTLVKVKIPPKRRAARGK